MARTDLDTHFGRVDTLISEIEKFVPEGTRGAVPFRADLAGLVVVAMAASYEACVKGVLVSFASAKHVDFELFANRQFDKLSSRVAIKDLHRYGKVFNPSINSRFKAILTQRKTNIYNRTGNDIQKRYEQILEWRHEFAHGGVRNTTISEAVTFHTYAKRVIYAFDQAFEEFH